MHHTEDVEEAVQRLALVVGVRGEYLMILRTGAVYHDTGFVKIYERNEHIGVAIAKEALPEFGYSPGQIERVGQIIMPTRLVERNGRMVQAPDSGDILQMLMCDGDLDNLGRPDFFAVSENFRRELNEYGHDMSFRQGLELSLRFQEAHEYFTEAAKALRGEGKRRNIEELKKVLGNSGTAIKKEELVREIENYFSQTDFHAMPMSARGNYAFHLQLCAEYLREKKLFPDLKLYDFRDAFYVVAKFKTKAIDHL